ncbi:MAG: efflux RND transporter periplasmic adaptor subunit, partial [Sulfurimonas sp.]|nr:efflux RND transporter periplasmic adaptor subunit [Sulfurimonas sp.]
IGQIMKRYLMYITIIIILGFGFYSKVYIPKHTFKTTEVNIADMSLKVNGVGNLGAKEIYKVGSIYGGKVFSFEINEGDFIKKGTLIAKIDSVDLSDKIDELDANIKRIQSDIKALKLDKKSAITSYNYQEVIYKKNYQLFKKEAISELDFKKYKTNRDVSKLQVGSISSKIDSLYAQIIQLEASSDGLKQRLSRYIILAPIDGYITKKLISNFAIINPNQTLVEIVNPKDVWVETHIDTRISGDVKLGDFATVKLRSSDIKYKGKVTNIKPVNNSVTNEREIDISFDKLPIPFYLEEQAIVDITIKELKNIIKIPLTALTTYKEKNGVWIVKNKIINFKEIKILAYSNNGVATKNLASQDILAIPNPKKKTFTNGMKIYND